MSPRSTTQTSLTDALRRLWPDVRPFRGQMIAALLLAGGLTIVGMLPPLFMRRLINDVAADGRWGQLPLLIGGLFAIVILRAIMTWFNARTIAFVGQRLVARLRLKVFRHLLRLPARFFERTSIGALMQRVMGDVGAVQSLVTGHIVTLCVDFVTAVFAVTVMLRLSPTLTLLTAVILPVFYLNYRFWTRRIQDNSVQMRSQMDHVSSLLQERMSSHDLVASYAQEDETLDHFRDRARATRDTAIRGAVYNLGFNHVTQFVNAAGNSLLFCAAVYLHLRGDLGYGDVVAFAAYAGQLLGPVVRFVQILQASDQSMVSIRRMEDLLSESPELAGSSSPHVLEPPGGDIEFDRFRYDDPLTGRTVLDDLDLVVPDGRNLTLVGPAASGKSTLLAAIRRGIDPTDGALRVGGTDLRTVSPLPWRRSVPVVRESTGLFSGTLRSNLAYGENEASDETLREVLAVVGLDELVNGLEKGLDTRVGPGGIRLSAGQRQRLGVARALVCRPRMLILDEATAALDAASAAELTDAIFQYLPDTTVLTVARRLGEASENAQIVVLKNGRILESGTHDELLERRGEYRRLYEVQYGPLESGGAAP